MIKRVALITLLILALLFTPGMVLGEFNGAMSREYMEKPNQVSKVEDQKSTGLPSCYLKDILMNRGSLYVDNVKDNSINIETQGIFMAKTGSLYYVGPGGQIRKEEGVFEWDDKMYYSRTDGIIVRNRLVEYEGNLYGAQADGSLVKDGWVKFGKLTYYFDDYKVDDTCIKALEVLDSVGYDLKEAFLWSGTKLPYFSFDSKPSWGVKWYADYGFEMDRGNCYVMAATFYYFAKMLGYDARQVAGMVLSEHSWVEIMDNGVVTVYDPELYAETHGKRLVFGETYDHRFLTEYRDWEEMPLFPDSKGKASN